MISTPSVTELLADVQAGAEGSMDRLIATLHDALRARVTAFVDRDANTATEPPALVQDAWTELVDQSRASWKERADFYATAALLMRRIVIDHARRQAGDRGVDMIRIHEALESLAVLDPREAKVVELRYFGGLSDVEAAEVVGGFASTIRNDWRIARAWLHAELADSTAASATSDDLGGAPSAGDAANWAEVKILVERLAEVDSERAAALAEASTGVRIRVERLLAHIEADGPLDHSPLEALEPIASEESGESEESRESGESEESRESGESEESVEAGTAMDLESPIADQNAPEPQPEETRVVVAVLLAAPQPAPATAIAEPTVELVADHAVEPADESSPDIIPAEDAIVADADSSSDTESSTEPTDGTPLSSLSSLSSLSPLSRSFVARHRAPLAIAAAAILAIGIGSFIATRQVNSANADARTADRVSAFLQHALGATTNVLDVTASAPQPLTLPAVLDSAAHRLPGEFHDLPLVEASLH
ncbi:MAG: ECF-type sigma factor, partial [Gemmatimonadales bacterium]